jgi:hypothetical protein
MARPNIATPDLARRRFRAQAERMADLGTLQAAWACPQCRLYRRVALALAVAAACSLILL